MKSEVNMKESEKLETAQSEQSNGCNCKQWMIVSIVLMVFAVSGAYFLGMSARITNEAVISVPSPQIISSPTLSTEPTPTPVSSGMVYTPGVNWKTATSTKLGISLCLPPKWILVDSGAVEFDRDPGYKPTVAFIRSQPYGGGSRREEFIRWEVRGSFYGYTEEQIEEETQRVLMKSPVEEISINGKAFLKINLYGKTEYLVIVVGDRLIYFGSGYNEWVNDNPTAYQNDLYTMAGCIEGL